MITILTIVHIVVCLFLVGIVLLQHGKGADLGATFGGSSQTVFGTEGPLPLLNKVTTAMAVVFMLSSIGLAYYSAQTSKSSVMRGVKPAAPVEQPAKEAPLTVPMPEKQQDGNQAQQPFPATGEEGAQQQ